MAKPDSLRLFFALWPPSSVVTVISAQLSVLRQKHAARWIEPEQLHMTLAFLGSTPASRLADLADIAKSIQMESFPLTLDHLQSWRKAGILCLAPRQVPAGLLNLAADLTTRLRSARFPQEERAFRPHLTVARKFSGNVGDTEVALPALGWQAERFSLVESVSGPGGSRYRRIHDWPLGRSVTGLI